MIPKSAINAFLATLLVLAVKRPLLSAIGLTRAA